MGTKKIKDGVTHFTPDAYTDFRGSLWTLWKKGEKGKDLSFNHDKVSTSRKDVLRGIHGDNVTTKLITCVHGEVYCVAADNRTNSETYRGWRWIMLSHSNRKQIILPPGVGLGYLVMSENASILYKWSYKGDYPDVEDQFTIKWNSLDFNIDWPITEPILSKRDK